MEKLIFATNNQHKVEEIRSVVNDLFEISSLKDEGIDINIPEPYDTLEENAAAKSRAIYKLTGNNCISEDTGLEVSVLNGKPGVKSARYAGQSEDANANVAKLLVDLKDNLDRQARFRTVISLILNGIEYQFEGICNGIIATQPLGENGFGYDSIFVPDGDTRSFAQMELNDKIKLSHRTKASAQLLAFLSLNGKK